jgi:hypothetical protein
LDTGALVERTEKRETARKQQRITRQQQIESDEAIRHFLLRNRDPWSC